MKLKEINSADLSEKIQSLKSIFYSSLYDLWVDNKLIRRKESTRIIDIILKKDEKLIFIGGKAGYGKSNVLYEVSKELEDKSIPYLPLRLHLQNPSNNTPEQFGKDLDLSISPELSLYKIANGKKSVLIIDQLDAIRWTSKHSTQAWECAKQIINQALNLDNMVILLACRSYDLENDPRIKGWKENKENLVVKVDKLSIEEVKENVENFDGNWLNLNDNQKELLRVPLNLYLYSKIVKEQPIKSFSSEIDLFDRYYRERSKTFIENVKGFADRDWEEALVELITKLDKNQVLSIPKRFLKDRYKTVIEALVSLNILVSNNGNISFFHQSFFDYVFARIFFQSDKDIIEWLKSNEQSLFRREQLRQILKFSHKYNHSSYQFISDIKTIMSDDSIRFHLQHLTLQVLGGIYNPTIIEWQSIKSLLAKEEWEEHILYEVLLNNEKWFDLLYEEGVWEEWLTSEDEKWKEKIVEILSNYSAIRSKKIVELFSPYLDSSEWSRHFKVIISRTKLTVSREFFNFVLEVIKRGHFDRDRIYDREENMEWMAELIGVWLERQIDISEDELSQEYMYFNSPIKNSGGILNDLIEKVSEKAPKEFIEYVLPQIKRLITKTPIDEEGFLTKDKIWDYYLNHKMGSKTYDMKDVLIDSMKNSFIKIAKDYQDYFLQIAEEIEDTSFETIQYLILNGYNNASTKLADDAINYVSSILKKVKEQEVEHRQGWGEEVRWTARSVINRHSDSCNEDALKKLKRILLLYYESWDFYSIESRHNYFKDKSPSEWYLNSSNRFGRVQYILLSAIPEGVRSDKVQQRILELKRKFGDVKRQPRSEGGIVASPIRWEAIEFMSDEQWLSAIDEYKLSEKENTSILEGGPRELSHMLETQAHKHGYRFAQLMFEFPLDCHSTYFSAILRGTTKKEVYKFDEEKDLVEPTEPASFEQVCDVIRYLSDNFGNSFGKEICNTIERFSDKDWPDGIIDLIINYTLLPHEDKRVFKTIQSCHDLLNNGINLLEGAAASSITGLLFKDYGKFNIFEEAIRNLVNSPSISIRSCAAECCLPILNIDRDLAVDIFLQLIDTEDERLFATRYVGEFLKYAYHTHYEQLENLIKKMIKSSNSEVAELASIIQLRYWLDYNKKEDLAKECINGSEANKIGAAKLFVNVFYYDKYFAKTVEPLKRFFNDSSEEVRQQASRLFFDFEGEEIYKLKEILSSFINSLAFENNHAQMLRALEKCYNLKEIANEIFEIINKISDNSKTDKVRQGRYFYSSSITPLLLKLYDDSSEMYSSDIREKCLESIDKMLKARVGDMISKLREIDR